MRRVKVILSVLVCISLYIQWKSSIGNEKPNTVDSNIESIEETGKDNISKTIEVIANNVIESDIEAEGLHQFIGKSGDEIKSIWGVPDRIDPSSYDYVWWIYKTNPAEYLQFGILENKVVTIYGIGKELKLDPYSIGQSYDDIVNKLSIKDTHSIQLGGNSYRFELTDHEKRVRPLFQFGDVWAQLYIDTFTNKLSSVRFLDSETLLKQRPYELIYRGVLLSPRELSIKEWKAVEKGNALQILDITNMLRQRHNLDKVEWHEETAQVAFLHSQDMMQNQYFSHDSPTRGGLVDRLKQGNIKYYLAGENIAAKYVDGIAAVEGWLNSEGHRKTLLNAEFTHLGVGVYEKYYTQNFISSWN
jgi:uncharacterized protein YkwD